MPLSPRPQSSKFVELFSEPRRDVFRLYCFHFAGGAANVFAELQALLPPWVEVRAVQLAGRGLRYRESPFHGMEELIQDLLGGLHEELEEMPFAFLGYSMGAAVAYALTRTLVSCERSTPEHLFVAAQKAPTLPNGKPFWHTLDREELIDRLRQLGGTSEVVLGSTSLMDMLLRMMRADFSVVETYTVEHPSALSIPVTAFCGSDDWLVPPEKMLAWRSLTRCAFQMEMIPGNHFFIQSHRAEFARLLSIHLEGMTHGNRRLG